jgi:hypothetical protein
MNTRLQAELETNELEKTAKPLLPVPEHNVVKDPKEMLVSGTVTCIGCIVDPVKQKKLKNLWNRKSLR